MQEIDQKLIYQFPDLSNFLVAIQKQVQAGFFEKNKPIFINRTPGRLDLMGGNDDYTGGLVFETTIREATFVAIQAREDHVVRFYNPAVKSQGWIDLVEFSIDDLVMNGKLKSLDDVRDWITEDPNRAWCAYILGDLYYLLKKFPHKTKHGFLLYFESDVPIGKGVSSSAALEVAPMKAMAEMFGIHVEGVNLAEWTQWIEIALTRSACGIMDQLTVVMGEEDHFVPMLCQPCLPKPLVRLPENLKVWGIDSGIRHSVAGIEYETARAATFMGYRCLCEMEELEPKLDEKGILPRWVDPKWEGYLANLSPSLFRKKYERRLPEQELGSDFSKCYPVHLDPFTPVRPEVTYPVRGATRYAIEENWRVHTFYSLISQPASQLDEIIGNLLGELMYQSHFGYTECGLGTEATDKIVELVRLEKANGLLGAKVTGGGAGGTVAVLGWNNPKAEKAFNRIHEKYAAWSKQEPYIFRGSSAGCDKFGVLRVTYPE